MSFNPEQTSNRETFYRRLKKCAFTGAAIGAAVMGFLVAQSTLSLSYASYPPASSIGGRFLLFTDSILHARDNGGGSFSFYGPLYPMVPPPSSGWSWDNQGSSTIDSTYGYEYLHLVHQSATNMTARLRTAPATPYSVDMGFLYDGSGAIIGTNGTPQSFGAVFGDGSGKRITFGPWYDSVTVGGATLPFVQTLIFKWTSSTSASAAYNGSGYSLASAINGFRPLWLQLTDDGTNLIFSQSIDGRHWHALDTRSRTNFFGSGPTLVGFGGYNSGTDSVSALIHWYPH